MVKNIRQKGKTICLQLKNIRQKIAPPNRIKTCFGLAIKNLGAVFQCGHSPEVAFYRIRQNT